MKKILLVITISFLMCLSSYARPEYSVLMSFGVKCQNCHYNIQGGGVRNNPGWSSRKDAALFKIPSIFDKIESNTFIKDMFTVGIDFRLQNAVWPGVKTRNSDATKDEYIGERKTIPMQLSPYLVFEPAKWLGFEGFWNMGYDIEKNHYPGQQRGAFSVNIRPSDDYPYLRVGFFQPTLGTKYDDHTLLIHKVVMPGSQAAKTLKPDDVADWAVQLDYEKYSWMGASFGVMRSNELGRALTLTDYLGNTKSILDTSKVSWFGRIAFYPTLGHNLNTMAGAMFLYNGPIGKNTDINNTYFYFLDLFFHIGLTDKLALMTEYVSTEKQYARTTDNFLVELNYQIKDWWNLFVRAERGTTTTRGFEANGTYYKPYAAANQFVFGTHFFPIPYVDILPEYRLYRNEEFKGIQGAWDFQLHVFF